jgi:hypothetical protein
LPLAQPASFLNHRFSGHRSLTRQGAAGLKQRAFDS